MALEIIKQETKNILEREEGIAVMESIKTPSYAELKKELAEKFKTEENLIVIKRIGQQFGKHESKINFYVYKNEEAMKKAESSKKETKGAVAEQPGQ